MLKDVFGFVGNQEEATYGLGHKLNLTRNKDEAVLDKAVGTADARIKIDHLRRCIPQYTPSIPQRGFFSKQYLSE